MTPAAHLAWSFALARAQRAWIKAPSGRDEAEESIMRAIQYAYLDAQTAEEEAREWGEDDPPPGGRGPARQKASR